MGFFKRGEPDLLTRNSQKRGMVSGENPEQGSSPPFARDETPRQHKYPDYWQENLSRLQEERLARLLEVEEDTLP